jgi:pimeloyl-ACP methyl ester carboxylesterase
MPRAKVNGVELNYEVHGDGYPLVLAHGFTASMDMWDDQIPAFAKKYRVVVYDSRGHGASEAPADLAQYDLWTCVEDQRALMDRLDIREAYVGGLSMGGMIAMRFALKYPERVRALLLCDTGPGLQGPHRHWFDALYGSASNLVRTEGVGAWLKRMWPVLAQAFPPQGQLPAGVRRHLEGLEHMSADGFLGGAQALRDQESVLERLSEIRVPTLIIVGDRDLLLGDSRAMQQRIAGNRFVLIRNSLHGTAVWQPEAFATAVLDFLALVDAGQPVAGERVL